MDVTSISDHADAKIEVATPALAPASPPAANGATLAPPIILKALSDATSSDSGAKTPTPEEDAAK